MAKSKKGLGSLADLATILPDAPVNAEPTTTEIGHTTRGQIEQLEETTQIPAQPEKEPVALDQRDIEAGAFFVKVLGKNRAVQVLTGELQGERTYGRERAQGAIKAAVARILDNKPRREAGPLWDEFHSLPLHSSRTREFDEAIDAVHEAVTSGASERWMAEQKRLREQMEKISYPEPPEWGDGHNKQYEYQEMLEEWAQDYSEAQLKAMNFDAHEIARRWAERERKAAEKREEDRKNEAIRQFEETGDFEALKTTFGYNAEYAAAKSQKWAWICAKRGDFKASCIDFAPSADWLSDQTDVDWLIDTIRNIKRELREPFREQLLLCLPYTPDENHVVVHKKCVIDGRGLIYPLKTSEEQPTALWANKPDAKGWVAIREEEYDTTITLYGPRSFAALQEALTCQRGTTDIRPWLAHFGRHPQKGFGRFYFEASFGRSRDSMFISVDDRLAARLDMIDQLPSKKDADYPDNIFYLPAEFVKKDRGGHFRFNPKAKSTAIAHTSSHHGQQLSRRYTGEIVHHKDSGTAHAWTLSAHTNKHDVSRVVALIDEGKELHLDTGMAIRNEGGVLTKIPGGALSEEEKKMD